MKPFIFLLALMALLSACGTKTTESTTATDSISVDSTVQADTPAPAILAFSQLAGYTVRNTVGLSDSVNFIFLSNQQELDKQFVADKASSTAFSTPDFLINHTFAVVCLPSRQMTTIVLDKVELGDAINVYLTIERGEMQAFTSKPAQVFSIEKRDGFSTMQFFVNGKESKAIMLPVN